MHHLDMPTIHSIADSEAIFKRGKTLFQQGAYLLVEDNARSGHYRYEIDGNYGDYETVVRLTNGEILTECTCPYPGDGCKHVVAVLHDIAARQAAQAVLSTSKASPAGQPDNTKSEQGDTAADDASPYLTPDELKRQVLEDRAKRANKEDFQVELGDMAAGEHLLRTTKGREYTVTLHDPAQGLGHCTCPDFLSNCLGTCKHLIFLTGYLAKKKPPQGNRQNIFPFLDIYWDSQAGAPRFFGHSQVLERADDQVKVVLEEYFDEQGAYRDADVQRFPGLLDALDSVKIVRVRQPVLDRVSDFFDRQALLEMETDGVPELHAIRATLYPYQMEGVRFGLYKKAVLIGDEMGLGKTLQAIVLAVLKKRIFGFSKVLVVTLASLKDQWQREIQRFIQEQATVLAGSFMQRRRLYLQDSALFKITNYEAVLRDNETIAEYQPDLVILDEAQRIKNFVTKTAESIKAIPRKHSLVLTGTPLENRLEDIYSIVQFLDPDLLSPLWRFAAEHFLLSRHKKDHILGYRNLNALHARLKPLVIRRRKEEVLTELPAQITNTYTLDLHPKQAAMHRNYSAMLSPLLNKKYLTPMDLRRIQELLLCMRRVCDSTYLIDRKTNFSPKLDELQTIIHELVVQSGRKVVIFSEWTTMTYLIGKQLSDAGIPFIELSGRIPVHKRQPLIDEFSTNPDCRVFLSTDAGGTGLNLQAADCVINFEPPWNPAKLNQRIGRVNRIGQASSCVNVINLVTKDSIEERILSGLRLKTDLFKGVLDGQGDQVDFSREKRNQLLNELRDMLGEPAKEAPRESMEEELPEDTPHYLNPEVLAEAEEDEKGGVRAKEQASMDGKEPEHPHQLHEVGPDQDGLPRVLPDHGLPDHSLPGESKPEEHPSDVLSDAPPEALSDAPSAPRSGPPTQVADQPLNVADEEPDPRRETTPGQGQSRGEQGNLLASQPPEKVEHVLNNGLEFISGLLEMATGQKIERTQADKPLVNIDRETGEVTMRFKLF
jgi:superfamily II DNA or RNA helicase